MRALSTPTDISHESEHASRLFRLPPDLIGIGLLTLATLFVAWDRLLLDHHVSSIDNATFYMPWYSYLGDRLRHGDIPGWLPSIFSGVPFAGDPQSGWMYVPAMLLFSILPAIAALKTFILLHYFVAAFSMYGLCRVFGIRRTGSLAAAIAFEFGPFLKYTACCVGYMTVATWVPLSLLGIELASKRQTWLGRAGCWLIAAFALSQELAGWIGQGAYYGLLAAGGFLVFRSILSPHLTNPSISRRLVEFATHAVGVYGFSFGLAAAGVLPRLDAVSRSSRAEGVTTTLEGDFTGWSLVTLIARLIDVNRGEGRWYIGGAVLALAIMAPFINRQSNVFYFVGFTLVALVLTLNATPVHQLFFFLPKFEVLHEHVPSRILMVIWVGPCFLTGAAIDVLANKSVPSRSKVTGVFASIAITALLVIFVLASGRRVDSIAIWMMLAACALALVVALLTSTRFRQRLPSPEFAFWAVMIGLVLILFWDGVGQWYGEVEDVHAAKTMSFAADDSASSGASEFLRDRQSKESPFRYFGFNPGYFAEMDWLGGYRIEYRKFSAQSLLVNNRAIMLGLEDAQGYDPVQIERYMDFFNALNGYEQEYHELDIYPSGLNSPLLNLLNARYVVVPADVPPGRPDLLHLSQMYPTVFADKGVRVLENDNAVPRAWIVHDARQVEKGFAVDLLTRGTVDPTKTVLIERPPPDMSRPADSTGEHVMVTGTAGDSVNLNARVVAPGMLVISDAYDPAWKAYVDGKRVDLYVADHAFRAIPLAAGEHTIELRYDPSELKIGLIISTAFSLISLAVVLALGQRWLRTRRAKSVL